MIMADEMTGDGGNIIELYTRASLFSCLPSNPHIWYMLAVDRH